MIRVELNKTHPAAARRPAAPAGTVKQIRQRQGLTQEALAELSGVSPATVSLVERHPTFLSDRIAYKLAVALNVPRETLR